MYQVNERCLQELIANILASAQQFTGQEACGKLSGEALLEGFGYRGNIDFGHKFIVDDRHNLIVETKGGDMQFYPSCKQLWKQMLAAWQENFDAGLGNTDIKGILQDKDGAVAFQLVMQDAAPVTSPPGNSPPGNSMLAPSVAIDNLPSTSAHSTSTPCGTTRGNSLPSTSVPSTSTPCGTAPGNGMSDRSTPGDSTPGGNTPREVLACKGEIISSAFMGVFTVEKRPAVGLAQWTMLLLHALHPSCMSWTDALWDDHVKHITDRATRAAAAFMRQLEQAQHTDE